MNGDPTEATYILRLSMGKEYPISFDTGDGIARIKTECGQRLGLVREQGRDFCVFVFRGALQKRSTRRNAGVRELADALRESFAEQATLARLAAADALDLHRYRAVLMAEFESSSFRDRHTTPYTSWRLEIAEASAPARVLFQTGGNLPDGCLVRIAGQEEPVGWTEESSSGNSGVRVKLLHSQKKRFTEEGHAPSGALESVPVNQELQNKIDAIEDFHSAKCVEGRTQIEQDAFSTLRRELLGDFRAIPLSDPSAPIVGLDEHQHCAVDLLSSSLPLTLVQGPPGTGKTQVIAFAVQKLLDKNPTARIAIASQANPAVDEAIAKIQERFPNLRIYRDYSAAAKEKYASLDRGVSVEDYRKNLIHDWTSAAAHPNPAISHMRRWLSDSLLNAPTALSRLLQHVLANRSQVVACTLSRLATISRSAPLFDLVIVDEAAKASVPETMIAANCAKRLALVGDHNQLLPFLDESFFEHSAPTLRDRDDLKHLWDDSLFARLWRVAPEDRKVFLQIMRRSRPAIAQCVSKCFYGGSLIAGRDNTSDVLSFTKSLLWVDAREGNHRAVSRTKSLYNPLEIALALQVCEEVEQLARQKTPSVAIIAFHREQAARLKTALATASLKFQPTILTVDASQGGQWDVVVLSLARTHGSSGFVGNPNRFNVALSRAKDLCVIIGRLDYAIDDRTKGSCLNRVADYFQNFKQPGKWVSFLNANQSLRSNFGITQSRR